MYPTNKFWWFVAFSITVTLAVFVGMVVLFWHDLTPQERAALLAILKDNLIYPFSTLILLLVGVCFLLDGFLNSYIIPVNKIADEVTLIHSINHSHRIRIEAGGDVARLVRAINEAASRFEVYEQEVREKYRQVKEALEEEKNFLAGVIAELPKAVLVCNGDGRILLYNRQAKRLLSPCHGDEGGTDACGCYVGLGRSIFSLFDKHRIVQAMEEVQRMVAVGASGMVTRFVLAGPDGRLFRTELLSLLNRQQQWHGFVLTADVILVATATDTRNGPLHSVKIQDAQSSLAGIEAAIEEIRVGSDPSEFNLKGALERILQEKDALAEALEPGAGSGAPRIGADDPPAAMPAGHHKAGTDNQSASLSQGPPARPEFYDFDLFHQPGQIPELEQRRLTEISFTVFDTETTGLDPRGGDEIISIGAVRIVNNRLLHEEIFEQLVDPLRPIPLASTQIHGLQRDTLAGQPTIDRVLPHFHRFAEDSVLVAHNAAFDMRMLQVKEAQTGVRFIHPVLDTMLLAAVVHPWHRNHALEAVARRTGVRVTGRHTALGDALITAELLLKLIPLLAIKNIVTLKDAIDASQKTFLARMKY